MSLWDRWQPIKDTPQAGRQFQALYANGRRSGWSYFGAYSIGSIVRQVLNRGHSYAVRLNNGQLVTIRPKVNA